jgi:hypothetical protein
MMDISIKPLISDWVPEEMYYWVGDPVYLFGADSPIWEAIGHGGACNALEFTATIGQYEVPILATGSGNGFFSVLVNTGGNKIEAGHFSIDSSWYCLAPIPIIEQHLDRDDLLRLGVTIDVYGESKPIYTAGNLTLGTNITIDTRTITNDC